ncbi:hypothetical protein Tco_0820072 [Tanacetum coccineum]|uniref:Uncharacterized protein n=1 Tax=Tanacetum coccineum TaxID=301880 RepID=A0ABQ5ACD0_9ASTR
MFRVGGASLNWLLTTYDRSFSVMDVEDVEEWVVWIKPESFYAQSMVFEEDSKKRSKIGIVGLGLEEDKRPRTPLRESVECVSELGLHLLGSFPLIYRPLDERESLQGRFLFL